MYTYIYTHKPIVSIINPDRCHPRLIKSEFKKKKKKTYAAPKVVFSITLKMEKAGNPPT